MMNAISRHLHGSKRKEIKIRRGYKPPEDMEVYIPRNAEASKNRGNRGGVPGVEGLDDTKNRLGTGTTVTTKKDAKKMEEATKKAKKHGGAHRTNGDS